MKGLRRRFPAEWEKQQAIILCFPHNGNDWPGKYQAIQWAFVEFIKKICIFEPVILVVANNELRSKVIEMLQRAHVNMDEVSFIIHKTNRSWMRDSAPIIIQREEGEREALNFNFNGWAKYSNYQLDRKTPKHIAEHLKLPLTQVIYKGKPVVLEGGALETNGQGILITSEECLLHPNIQVRNPDFSKNDYEAIFKEYLGIEQTLWLGDGITGDDTHGHIDDLCRFVSPDTVLTVVEEDKQDANYKALNENLHRLKSLKLKDGGSLKVKTLPMPKPLYFEEIRLPASYANFLILNACVLMPTFNDPNDRMALNILADCFPERKIIGISAVDLIWGFGTLHCLSQQVPACNKKY